MVEKKRKIVSLFLIYVLLIFMFTGCSTTDKTHTSQETEKSGTTFNQVTEKATLSPETTIIQEPLDFTWEPYVYSEMFRKVYGEETEQTYYTLVDTILNYGDSFVCGDEETMYNILTIARVLFPLSTELVSDVYYKEGQVFLSYVHDVKEHEQVINQFEEQIINIIKSAVMEGDSHKMAAISLYYVYSGMISYDHDAADNDVTVDVSCYRALTELEGICQSFASAYAYLCLQCDIDAVSVGGMTELFEAHEWTMLTLDGKYYYADPTFENGMYDIGLRYFGMTAAQRELEGGFIADEYNIGNTNELFGRDIDVVDEEFAPLWEAANIITIERKNGRLHIQCERVDKTQFEFVVG